MAAAVGKIGLREVRALAPHSELFDGPGGLPGFGVRRRSGPGVSYFVMFRTAEARQRRFTIGTHGAPWTPETARAKARTILAEAAGGADPAAAKREAREAPTIKELCESYMRAAKAGRLPTRRGGTKKASTLATDQSRIDAHILPLLGHRKARSVTTSDLESFMYAVADGKTHRREKLEKAHAFRNVRGGMGTASRTIGLLGAVFAYGVKVGICPDNPARGVLRPADGKRKRRLSDDEYRRLHDGLVAASEAGMWPHAVAAARFLALTGWRSGEAINLRWRDLHLEWRTALLPDTKTGFSMRPLSRRACEVLAAQKAATGGEPEALVFPPSRGETTMTGFKKFMARIVKLGGLPPDVTAHVLRHSFASVAGSDLKMGELTVGAMIGHQTRGGGVTPDYIHHADDVLLAAADKVADETARRMDPAANSGAEIIQLHAAGA
ncbi:site-specific integrase [Roseococcus sp. SDR]|uniref:tyrosine-type recombinase/integrase n=1 Tax=Roseococcus sp. SDR TaxID=2835532 RepID=UPI001BCCF68C|nr:site-specific integrase [Roseococcus sp. SDR]MBS7789078.1 site-specific integrase [Roseococcus sp. SDR]MBV1844392.1 site-specific integrase [Roseococcus sp. SDR]